MSIEAITTSLLSKEIAGKAATEAAKRLAEKMSIEAFEHTQQAQSIDQATTNNLKNGEFTSSELGMRSFNEIEDNDATSRLRNKIETSSSENRPIQSETNEKNYTVEEEKGAFTFNGETSEKSKKEIYNPTSGNEVIHKDDIGRSNETGDKYKDVFFKNVEQANFQEGLAPSDPEKVRLISDLLDKIPELNPSRWEKLSVEERLNVLQNIDNQIAEITHRPPCKVVIEDMDRIMLGYNKPGKIALNSELLFSNSPADMKLTLRTLIHEGRHDYQKFNLLQPEGLHVEPNNENMRGWRINYILGYDEGKPTLVERLTLRDLGFERYFSQPVELDAHTFAEEVINATKILRDIKEIRYAGV